jgi:hypothetical protein
MNRVHELRSRRRFQSSPGSKDNAAQERNKWMQPNNIRVLNVAGPRASKEPKAAEFVITTLDEALKP